VVIPKRLFKLADSVGAAEGVAAAVLKVAGERRKDRWPTRSKVRPHDAIVIDRYKKNVRKAISAKNSYQAVYYISPDNLNGCGDFR